MKVEDKDAPRSTIAGSQVSNLIDSGEFSASTDLQRTGLLSIIGVDALDVDLVRSTFVADFGDPSQSLANIDAYIAGPKVTRTVALRLPSFKVGHIQEIYRLALKEEIELDPGGMGYTALAIGNDDQGIADIINQGRGLAIGLRVPVTVAQVTEVIRRPSSLDISQEAVEARRIAEGIDGIT